MLRFFFYCWLLLLLILPHSTTTANTNVTYLDCGMRQLALEYAQQLLNQGDNVETITHVHAALRLSILCGLEVPVEESPTLEGMPAIQRQRRRVEELCPPTGVDCVYVAPKNSSKDDARRLVADGSIDRPWTSLSEALVEARRRRQTTKQPTNIVLRQGTHFLSETLQIEEQDNGLSMVGYPGEQVWISGGIALEGIAFRSWSNNTNILVADLSPLLKDKPLPKVTSLFTTNRRYIRARYPNADPEVDQWGYASHHRLDHSLAPDNVLEWHKPPAGTPPNFTLVDFRTDPPRGIPVKNNSAQPGYNWYASGHGGVCSEVWGNTADSYWCSNASQGGWAEVDQECATTGQLQIPVGMTYNRSTDVGQRLDQHSNVLVGGIVHAWHSQSWAMHMFEIESHSPGQLVFAKGGGNQGGRNWCRCDQCTYAGGWCGQHQTPPVTNDTRLISGTWTVENVLAELDQPGEFYFDKETLQLYVWPNSTLDTIDFRMGLLDRILQASSKAFNITIENIGFRDMAPTYMGEWSAPSGGDWALHRGAAVFLENVQEVTIRNCRFSRLDGNAIFLSRKTRNVTIEQNIFEWIGESAIATWGDTDGYDATGGEFPMHTLIQHNVMRELGIYQKQSSAVGQCKAALTTIRNNIMFNMPRAAINFNDMLGGGDVVEGNLIFNTCRESGDHGPINSWDRQPFLTLLKDGSDSFDPIPRRITNNFIFANYGASQGVDNDDGSSWYEISKNLFYSAEGFKMDYGGHDSVFEDNLVMSYPYDGGQCFNMGGFLEGHGDTLRRNICIVGLGNHMDSGCGDPSCASSRPEDEESLEVVGRCQDSPVSLEQNQYFTPDGKAMFYCEEKEYSLAEMQEKFHLEVGSSEAQVPSEDVMLNWAKSMTLHQTPPIIVSKVY